MTAEPWTVVGAGGAGRALRQWLQAAGKKPRVIAGRRAVPRWLKELEAQPRGNVVLAVPDDAIEPVARQMAKARRDWRGWQVVHTSGARSARALGALAQRGASVGAVHPMMTFPRSGQAPGPQGVVFSVEGRARLPIKAWRGVELRLTASQKAAYHAAATLVGPGAVAQMAAAETVLARAGVRGKKLAAARRGLVALLEATARNLAAGSTRKAFTGPMARGDEATIAMQQKLLGRSAEGRLHESQMGAAAVLKRTSRSRKS